MTLGLDATGDIYYRNAGGILSSSRSERTGQALQVVSGLPAWQTLTGTRTVTAITAGTGISLSSGASCTTTCTISSNLTSASNSLSSPVSLNNTGAYFDGPSTAQGTGGTWLVVGAVTVSSTTADGMICKLWDGSTVADVGVQNIAAGTNNTIACSVIITPTANIKISCRRSLGQWIDRCGRRRHHESGDDFQSYASNEG